VNYLFQVVFDDAPLQPLFNEKFYFVASGKDAKEAESVVKIAIVAKYGEEDTYQIRLMGVANLIIISPIEPMSTPKPVTKKKVYTFEDCFRGKPAGLGILVCNECPHFKVCASLSESFSQGV
jgi:hypothetical protein